MNPTPLNVIVRRITQLVNELDWEAWKERHEARWPHANATNATIASGHAINDPTQRTAIHPDPINQKRADRIEATLRHVCRELEDECAAGQRHDVCEWERCYDKATIGALCRRHYDRQHKQKYRRRVRTTAQ
ncbi:MAG: hypothetical protein M3N32_07995 [Actinomycetota bacterium]|nr:hypothetical protein [Actinomycetota bacterium]